MFRTNRPLFSRIINGMFRKISPSFRRLEPNILLFAKRKELYQNNEFNNIYKQINVHDQHILSNKKWNVKYIYIVCFIISLIFLFLPRLNADESQFLNKNTVNYDIQKLCLLTGIDLKNADIDTVVFETQKIWLRSANEERWEMKKSYDSNEAAIMQIMDKLGFLKSIWPKEYNYNYALLLGARVTTMKKRFETLEKCIKRGVKIEEIVLLGGERELIIEEIGVMNELGFPKVKTEYEAMLCLVKYCLSPNSLNQVNIKYINAPKKLTSTGKLLRPTTADTIKQWIVQYNPHEGRVLGVSSAPFIQYQHFVVKSYIGNMDLETVGEMDNTLRSADVYLDNLARTLYQLKAVTDVAPL